MKKILILAYFYPPSGGAGVQRVLKFVKYLPSLGYLPLVVAGSGAESHFAEDLYLAKEAADFQRTDIRFTPFEGKIDNLLRGSVGRWTRTTMNAWMRAATRALEAVIKKDKPDLLFVSTSPFPATRVIADASEKYGIPWVLDMRDPWALDPIAIYSTKLHYYLEMKDMERACHKANAIIMNTPGALLAATRKLRKVNLSKFYCITNGWDNADFPGLKILNELPQKPMRVVHAGIFHTKTAEKIRKELKLKNPLRFSLGEINLLTRTPNYLFAAFRKLIDEKKIQPDSLQFIFAGAATQEDIALAQKYQLESCVKFMGYVDHDKSIALLLEGDVLFLPLHEFSDPRDPLIVPGKAYEYIAATKPILACVPPGDARNIICKSGLGYVCDPSDTDKIAETILDLYAQYNSQQGISVQPDAEFIAKFDRRQLTRDLVQVFESVLSEN